MPNQVWQAEKTWLTTWRHALDEFTGLAAEHYSLTDPSWISFGAGWVCLWFAVWQCLPRGTFIHNWPIFDVNLGLNCVYILLGVGTRMAPST